MNFKTLISFIISTNCFAQFAVESDLAFINAKVVEERFGYTYENKYPIMSYQLNGSYQITVIKDLINAKPIFGVGFLPLNAFEKIAYSAVRGTVQKGQTIFTYGVGGGFEIGKKNKLEVIYFALVANKLWTRTSKTVIPFYKLGYNRDISSKYSIHLGIATSKNNFCYNFYKFNCEKESDYRNNIKSYGGYLTVKHNL